jgi:hypothetical protein
MEPLGMNCPVLGSQISAVLSSGESIPPVAPPTTRTRPSLRSVAVWDTRGSIVEPVGRNAPETAGSPSLETGPERASAVRSIRNAATTGRNISCHPHHTPSLTVVFHASLVRELGHP